MKMQKRTHESLVFFRGMHVPTFFRDSTYCFAFAEFFGPATFIVKVEMFHNNRKSDRS